MRTIGDFSIMLEGPRLAEVPRYLEALQNLSLVTENGQLAYVVEVMSELGYDKQCRVTFRAFRSIHMKPLIIGEAPGKNGDPTKPIEGRIGARLAACCGLTLEDFLETFDRVNLLDTQPQDNGKGTDFNVKEAGRVARKMELEMPRRPLILLLGKRVAGAFRFTNVNYFQQVAIDGIATYVVPHPSGVNRWWNTFDNELAAIRFMHDVMKRLKQ